MSTPGLSALLTLLYLILTTSCDIVSRFINVGTEAQKDSSPGCVPQGRDIISLGLSFLLQKSGRMGLHQGLANFFRKRRNSKYFRLCRTRHLFSTVQFCPCGIKSAIDNMEMTDEHGCVPIKHYLQKQVTALYTH